MAENCLYCGTAFTKSRKNKIYCNNSCKQLGYFQRKYAGFNGTPQIKTVKSLSAPIFENLKIKPVNTVFTQTNPSTIKTVKPESETVKEINTVKPMENNVKAVKDFINVKELEDLFLRFSEKLTAQFNEAIVIMEQRLSAKYEGLLIKKQETENVKRLCNPLPFYGITKPLLPENHKTDFTLVNNPSTVKIVKPEEIIKTIFTEKKETVNPDTVKDGSTIEEEQEENDHDEQNADNHSEHLELYEIALSQDEEEETEDDEESGEQEEESENGNSKNTDEEYEQEETETKNATENTDIKAQQVKVLEKQSENAESEKEKLKVVDAEAHQQINNAEFSTSQNSEPIYQWVESKLLQNITKIVERRSNERFFSAIYHSYDDEAKSMRWLNERLRCLVEGIIKISNKKEVDKYTFLCLTDAFNRLVNSKSYKIAPNDYPHKQFIIEYCLKLNKIVKEQANQDNVRLHVPKESKARLIALRYDMMSHTNTLKFSEMDFTEPAYFLSKYYEKEKPETKKLDLTLLKSKRSGWQERYRAILKEKENQQKKAA